MSLPISKPTAKQVEKYLNKYLTLSNYIFQQDALDELIRLMPHNQDINAVLLKSSVLNDFYSTNIFSIYDVAKHIFAIPNIDERLKNGDISLVNEVKTLTISGKEKNFYSFATKYCCHHNQEAFPIYDSFVDKMLWSLNKSYPFAEFKREELKDYPTFKAILINFRQTFNLTQFSLRDIDRYLWLLGKEVFPRK